ncbi:MAG: DUF2309 domain-containing protein [Pirellulales bacterium]
MTLMTLMPPQHTALAEMIAAAGRFLPPQGPIDAFVAQNPLQGFEALPFEEAVVRAARLYKAQPFLPESDYRDELARGRIRVADLEAVLAQDLGDRGLTSLAGGRATLGQLHLQLLLHGVQLESDSAVRWTLTESRAIERLRDDLEPRTRARLLDAAEPLAVSVMSGTSTADASDGRVASELWHACVEASAGSRPAIIHGRTPLRHRDLILDASPTLDTDALVHPLLIRMVAAFIDQGVAAWPMPDRDKGFLAAVAGVYSGRIGPTEPWGRLLPARLRRIRDAFDRGGDGSSIALDVILEQLRVLGVPEASWQDFLTESLVALKGWAGMVRELEERPDRAPVEAVPARLVDFLAVRLLLDRTVAEWAAGHLGHVVGATGDGTLTPLWVELRDRHPPRRGPGSLSRSFLLHQVSQLLGLAADDIRALTDNEIFELQHAIAAFDSIARRRLFHLAYERRHRVEMLDALASQRSAPPPPAAGRPRAQAVFCIDDRCESFRRALEELAADVETFGAAGFFSLPMYFRGINDWHAVPLCPIVIRPAHTVTELPEDSAVADHRFRQSVRRSLGRLRGGMSEGSRSLLRGGILTSVGGALAAVPLVARVVFPRLTARLASRAAEFAGPHIPTRLALKREGDARLADVTQSGFDLDEMAAVVRRLLEDIGLTSGFARLVAIIGHGSTSLNNPHESAYDCGACGGGRGGPNARAFALMANDPAVRLRLATGGLEIPDDVVFVGGMQDTCTSEIAWFDADRIPGSHRADFESFQRRCVEAGGLDAQERCRRFDSVPLDVSVPEALRRAQVRSADLAQVRPEYGHASNAACIVGSRRQTRGLYLDRRSFLVSYDPGPDSDGRVLERTLAAVGPVCGGINLAYLFSRVDPLCYGAGTKLPHNITGLVGVMDGHASDLRTGLPFQGVDIHEPVRLLMVVEAPPERIRAVLDRLPAVKNMVAKRWIQLVSWHPDTGGLAVQETTDGEIAFVPYVPESESIPVVPSSAAWFRGHRGNVPPARLLAGASGPARNDSVPS